jgi:Fe-S cluster assembly ATP-binding protein
MLKIQNLRVRVGDREILSGINLTIAAGEVHAIMGPNGSGKSTLSYVLAGRDGYEVLDGAVEFLGQNLLELSPEARAANGLFLAFQYPIEIPGVANTTFLREAVNSVRRARGETELDALQFVKVARERAKALGIGEDLLKRPVNAGFSGGEKKRNEVLQMALLEPRFAILDETDSGLDIDALKIVANGINALRSSTRSMLLITHYQRLLEYIVPDYIHVLAHGEIVRSGGADLALELERTGYTELREQPSDRVA